MIEMRPLGNRVLIKPHAKRSETASGLAIVEDWQPDTSGVVVALGDGIESRKKAVQRVLKQLMSEFSPSGESIAVACAMSGICGRLQELHDGYQPEHVCAVGDEVTFGVTAGTELDLGGELYLLVDENDLETLCVPIEATA